MCVGLKHVNPALVEEMCTNGTFEQLKFAAKVVGVDHLLDKLSSQRDPANRFVIRNWPPFRARRQFCNDDVTARELRVTITKH